MDRFGHEKVPLIDFVNKNGKMERTSSVVTDPQVSALEALKNHDHSFLKNLLTDVTMSVDINKLYPEEKFKTLLHIAVDREDWESSNLILDAGADPNIINSVLKTAPIHVAARKVNPQLLDLLLSHPRTDVNAVTGDGKTALHLLIQKYDYGNEAKILQSLHVVLKAKGVQVDKPDRTSEITPLYIAAAEKKNFQLTKMLAENGANLYGTCAGREIRDVLVESFGPDLTKSLLSANQFEQEMLADKSGDSAQRNKLMKLLQKAEVVLEDQTRMRLNLREFEETLLLLTTSSDLNAADTGGMNVVQCAADFGLGDHLRLILSRNGVDPNYAASGTRPPLILAALAGHDNVIKVLRAHKDSNVDDRSVATTDFSIIDPSDGATVLHMILRKPIGVAHVQDVEKYERCLEAIFDQPTEELKLEIRRIINKKDRLGNTALHYATQMWSQKVVRRLLEFGANIGVKNKYNEVPISHILPETMEKFLNEYCMTSEGNVTNDNFKITFKFDFLVPPLDDDRIKGLKKEGSTCKVSSLAEKDAESLTKENEKLDDDIPLPETEGLWQMSQSKKHQHLLKHPVIAAFLFLKWQRMGPAYNKNLLFYLAFVSLLTGYIFTLFSGRAIRDNGILSDGDACDRNESNPNEVKEPRDIPDDVSVLWYIVTVLLGFLTFREVLQFGVAPRRYFFSPENWLEVILMILTAVLLFHGPVDCHIDAKRQISAIIIVLAWSELITMVGRHPRLTVYNIYVTMFYKVSGTFILFLIWYSCYIIAFGLGFYILLHKDDGEKREEGEDEYIFFNHIGLSLVKTFTMFVGELEFGDLPIESTVGYLFLLAFIFLIVVVMMNLLNGLAVSDTRVIKDEAEIHSYKSQVSIVSYMESMMLGDPFNFLANWPAYIWLRHVPTCSLVGGGRLYRVPPIRAFFHTLTGARYVMLFREGGGLKNNSMEINPNFDSFRCSHLLPLCRCCNAEDDHSYLPETVVESAKSLIIEQSKESEDQTIQKLEARMERLEDLLLQLLNKK